MALLRAVGFPRRWLGALVMYENLALLLFGLAIGLGAALVAVAPHLFTHEAAIPWGSLAAMLILIAVVGFVAGLAAVRATLRAPLVAALRGE
jgi:ABC-type antimicrobial peptide transport system permease subunit